MIKIKRITPRTCLWPLTGSLVASFALSIGLTFRSDHHCYASVCGEVLFPLQARLHVVVWYCWLSISVTILALRAFHPSIRRKLQLQIFRGQLPVVGNPFTISGALVVFWILSLYGMIMGIWWFRLCEYFVTRGEAGGLHTGNNLVAAVALTGHFADVTMGMVLLPVARNSALSSFFRLSHSTTFAFHMIQAYVLFGLVLLHGLIYASWVSVYNKNPDLYRLTFPVLNPTYFYNEVWPGGRGSLEVWRASLIFTGSITSLIMAAMFLTTFPSVRRKHFNLFYFTHLLAIVAIIVICLHASTMFYCTAPGLAMWVLDWGMRIYELSGKMDSSLEAVGNGWFCLTLPLPRRRLDGCACYSPLAHFHIHHTESSIREIHPFTTITHLASQKVATPSSTERKVLASSTSEETVMIKFLFRKSKASRSFVPNTDHPGEEKSSKQWTNKLASLVDNESTREMPPAAERDEENDLEGQVGRRLSNIYHTSLRLEGPYFTPANLGFYNTVICLVAGTGVSGAIAIAAAFGAQSAMAREQAIAVSAASAACAIEPKVKPEEKATVMNEEKAIINEENAIINEEKAIINEEKATTVRPPNKRLSTAEDGPSCQLPIRDKHTWKRCIVVWSVREADYIKLPFFKEEENPGLEVRTHLTGQGHGRLNMEKTVGEICAPKPEGRTWVYLSGPNAFIETGEKACRTLGVEFYGARWS